MRARSCAAASPVELGPTRETLGVPRVAFSANGGLAAWSPQGMRLALRPLDRAGNPTGPTIEFDVPADLDLVNGLRALDGFYLVLLRDHSSLSGRSRMFALVSTQTGKLAGEILELDLGGHEIVDSVSDAAAHGVVVYAGGMSPNLRTARVINVHVAADGAISQSIRDFVDPLPGSRVFPSFSFSAKHTVAVLPEHIIVDGQLRTSPRDASISGLFVAPTFIGDKISIVGFTARGEDGKRRYGTISLTGKRRYDRDEEPQSQPIRAPFADKVVWVVTGTGDGGATFTPGLRGHVIGSEIKPTWAKLTSGIDTSIEWTGDQALVLYTAANKAWLAPLPCK